MALLQFNVASFRNLHSASFEFSDSCNIFFGANGSGKTSILEAIYYFGLGRSFRTHLLRRIINYHSENFTLFGKIRHVDNVIPAGVERSTIQGKVIRVAGENVSSNVEITKLLPLQLLNQNNYRLLEDGPKLRRQYLDWGLFHVEPSFLSLWRRVERVLEQRNALLRSGRRNGEITLWNSELADLGSQLHLLRQDYLVKLLPEAAQILQQLLPGIAIDINYFAGWDLEQSLDQVLVNDYANDMRLGYTSHGPHRADLKFTLRNVSAYDALSRGQQKLMLYGLQIAQGRLLRHLVGKRCLYLVDDIGAELDITRRKLLAQILLSLDEQIFVTGLEKDDLLQLFDGREVAAFHVEQGEFARVRN